MLGVLLVLVSLVTPWWSMTASMGSSGTWTGYLLPGTAASSCSGDCGSLYTTCAGDYCYGASGNSGEVWNNGLSSTNALYESVLALLVLSLLAGFFATFLGFRGAYRAESGRRASAMTVSLGLLATLFLVVALAVAVGGQPTSLASDFSSNAKLAGWFCASGTSPTNAFWGSNSGSCAGGGDTPISISYSWGASVGWYAGLVGLFLLGLGTVIFLTDWRAARRAETMSLSVPTPGPSAPPMSVTYPGSGVPPGAGFDLPPPPPTGPS